MQLRRFAITIFGFLALAACVVDPLDPAVISPTHRTAFSAGAGVVPSTQTMSVGSPVSINILDAGYHGSGSLTDMANFNPLTFRTCQGRQCPAGEGSQIAECRAASGGTTCVDRTASGAIVGEFSFFADQRFSGNLENPTRFISGVWHQSAAQQARAERVFSTMMTAYETGYGQNYARVADQRNAAIDVLSEIGGGTAPTEIQDTGTDTLARANRQVTVRNGYNIGNHSIERQSREVAARYSCARAQRIPEPSGAACSAFRALVIIEACTPSEIPPAAYNQDQPEFLRVAAGFANEGADLRGCVP